MPRKIQILLVQVIFFLAFFLITCNFLLFSEAKEKNGI